MINSNSSESEAHNSLITLQLIGNGLGGWGFAMAIANTMRDLHYTNKTLRIADDVWELFKEQKKESGLSCNLFLKKLLTQNKGRNKKKK